MDPNVALARLFNLATDGNIEEAQRYLDHLRKWIGTGGFAPDAKTTLEILKAEEA